MEKKYEVIDEWMRGIVNVGNAFNATSRRASPALVAEVDREYAAFASLDLSNMGRR